MPHLDYLGLFGISFGFLALAFSGYRIWHDAGPRQVQSSATPVEKEA